MAIEYQKLSISSDAIDQATRGKYLANLVALSKEWEAEGSCPSYSANDSEYFYDKELYVAISKDDIIAYALGEIKQLEEKTSYNEIGERAFELDELYVASSYRNRGIGKRLFQYLESQLTVKVDLIGVIATSHQYKDLLRFYIDELDLNFNHALLVKRL